MNPQGSIGIEGRIRLVRHDVRDLRGSGPDGSVEFEDLWEVGSDGQMRSRYPDRIVQDMMVRNKFTRRGLGYLMLQALWANTGTDQSKQPTEIIYPVGPTTQTMPNPFLSFILVGDDGGSPVYPGDAKVLWTESDGQWDAKIAAGNGTPVYGRRGIVMAYSPSGELKVVQTRYPNASPDYEYNEITVFAKANGSALQAGNDKYIDNFVIKSIALAYGNAATGAIGPGYNESYSQVGARAVLGLAPTVFTAASTVGGAANLTDRIYKHQNYVYGDGSASGLGSKTDLHKFVSPEVIANGTPGYVVQGATGSDEIADVSIGTLSANGGNLFTVKASGNIIKFGNAVADLAATGGFVAAHIRKTLTVANSTSNNRDFTVKRIVSTTEVEVFETVVTEATPTAATGTLATRCLGTKAFDGRVENEAWITKGAFDADAAGAVISGEKYVSIDTSGPHLIGRIWAKDDQRSIAGVRVIFPKGSIKDYCPNLFKVQTLNSTHLSVPATDPQPGYVGNPDDWTTQVVSYNGAVVDPSAVSQGDNIFGSGEYGAEYLFSAPVSTCGVRISAVQAVDATRKIEVAEFMAFELMSAKTVDTTNCNLKISVDGGSVYKTFTCYPVAATQNAQDIVDALNRVLYGWGLEAVRTTFGYVIVRATVSGNYSQVHLNGGALPSNPMNSLLGFPTTLPAVFTGLTQPFTKVYTDAVTFIYTQRMGGNFPKP